MNRRMHITPAILGRTNNQALHRLILVVILLAICATLIGCNRTLAEDTSRDYGATVEALLPTADPTAPPPTLTATAIPPTDTPAPTYTPRPQPTYTPWPTPTRATTEDRQPAIPFNAQLLDGSEFSLPDAYGSPTLLAFWAPW